MQASILVALVAWTERTDWIQVAPETHLRVLTRTHDDALPALIYQPFAGSWPQIHAGDHIFLPLADTFTLVTYDPRGVGRSTGAFNASAHRSDLEAVYTHAAARASRVYVVSISSATRDTLSLAATPPADGKLAGVLVASPTPPTMELLWTYWSPAIQHVWGVSATTLERMPMLAKLTLMLLRTPYHKCRDVLWCSGEFYNPWTYAGSVHYPHPFWTYLQAGMGMLAPQAAETDAYPQHLSVPHVHFWWGEHDPPAAWNAAYADMVRSGGKRVTVVPGAAHAAHLEDPGAFQTAVRSLVPRAERGVAPPAPATTRSATFKLDFAAQFVFGVTILLTALLAARLRPWIARKLVHVGIGVLLVHADLEDWKIRCSVYAATALTLALTVSNGVRDVMRFSHKEVRVDPGIVFYVCTCSLACAFQIEFVHLCPLFLADPMGAIVGRNVRTPKLYGSKSVGGTAAVWLTALVTLPEADLANRAVGATVVALLELFGGEYDNVCIGAFLLARAIGHA